MDRDTYAGETLSSASPSISTAARGPGDYHYVVQQLAGFLSTIDFTPSEHHPDRCLQIAEELWKRWLR